MTAQHCEFVAEEATTGAFKLKELVPKDELLFFVINVNDYATESEFDNVYGCRHSLNDGVMLVSDAMIGGKRVFVCGYGDVSNGGTFVFRGSGARVSIALIVEHVQPALPFPMLQLRKSCSLFHRYPRCPSLLWRQRCPPQRQRCPMQRLQCRTQDLSCFGVLVNHHSIESLGIMILVGTSPTMCGVG